MGVKGCDIVDVNRLPAIKTRRKDMWWCGWMAKRDGLVRDTVKVVMDVGVGLGTIGARFAGRAERQDVRFGTLLMVPSFLKAVETVYWVVTCWFACSHVPF
jgi:hypothetical protein